MLGELWSSRKFEGNSLSHPKVLSKFRGDGVAILSLENFRGRFFLELCDYGNLAKILGNKNAHPNFIGQPPVYPKKLGDEIVRSLRANYAFPHRQGCSAVAKKQPLNGLSSAHE